MKNIQNFLNFNESFMGKVDSRLVSKYKKWLESEKPDYFEVMRPWIKKKYILLNLISIVQVKKRSRLH
jgi:hypothetical protein